MDDNEIFRIRDELDNILNPTYSSEEAIAKINLLKLSSNDIIIYQTRKDFEKKHTHCNCFEYAFNLYKSNKYIQIKKKLFNNYMSGIFCNSSFVKWLIDEKKLNSEPEKGMKIIVIYSYYNDIKHAGVVENSNDDTNFYIISKFGLGDIYKHSKDIVPSSYGTDLLYYEQPKLNIIESFFIEYLQCLICNISQITN